MFGLVSVLVLWRLLPVFGLLLLATVLGGGNLGRGLVSLLALIVLVRLCRTANRHRRAEKQAAADLDHLQAQAEVVAEAHYRAWERRQYQRELAALHHQPTRI